MLWTFLPIAALMTITPGPGTTMVIRSALREGWRSGVLTVAGNSLGVAFLMLKLVGAAVLVWLGVQSLRRSAGEPLEAPARGRGHAFRGGLVTSLANPKLAVFFVALFPQWSAARSGA